MVNYLEITNPYLFDEGLLKRDSNFTTVVVYKTEDQKRLHRFISYLREWYSSRSSIRREIQVYVYLPFTGLHEVVYTDAGGRSFTLRRPELQVAGGIRVGEEVFTRLDTSLRLIDQVMRQEAEKFRRGEKHRAVILILFALHISRSEPEDARAARLLNEFLRYVLINDEYYVCGHCVFLFSETPELILDQDVLRRAAVIDIPASTDTERESLIRSLIQELRIQLDGVDIPTLVELARGLTLHEIESILLETAYRKRKLSAEIFIKYRSEQIRKSGLLEISYPNIRFEHIGGYQVLKDFIKKFIVEVLRDQERARRLGIEPPRGILFFGPPGTGKTTFAKAIAAECKLPFIKLRLEAIRSMWYGETEKNLARAIRLIEQTAPCIVFIDEVDRLGRRTGLELTGGDRVERNVLAMLLEWLGDENRKAIVIAATNRIEDLDEAFIRVGRFDYILPILYPDRAARQEILYTYLKGRRKIAIAEDEVLDVIPRIAQKTKYFTPAELRELVIRAGRIAFEEGRDVLVASDLERALQTFNVDVREREAKHRKYVEIAKKYCTDKRLLEWLARDID